MTPLTTAVRAACDAVEDGACWWPKCSEAPCHCPTFDDPRFFQALLTTARAEATEAAARVAEAHVKMWQERQAENVGFDGALSFASRELEAKDIAAAIRAAPATQAAGGEEG